MKIIAMVPARMGSKRVKSKNLRLLDGKPLIEHVLGTLSGVKIFNEIYINSEDKIFSEIADRYGVSYYNRPDFLSSDEATNDEFAHEFLSNIACDILIQVLPTSPFLTEKEVENFVDKMISDDLDTLVSVEHQQIACLYNGQTINFDNLKKNPPSQTMTPVMSYATALMGWRSSKFLDNIANHGVAYHGGLGKTDFFELKGYSTIDIDNEEDFLLAEAVSVALKSSKVVPQYYVQKINERSEVDVPSILAKDGVKINDLFDVNNEVVALSDILESMPKDVSWSKRVIDTDSNSMTIICQMPGEGNRRHYHPDWNEWWYIVEGEWEWEIEGEIKKIVKGEIVFMKKNRKHKITASGLSRAIRMAVSRADVAHVYED
jgi:CMP-N-acetylneuraminic acid synthetase/quercetin dioxygenase-like cupin family protein